MHLTVTRAAGPLYVVVVLGIIQAGNIGNREVPVVEYVFAPGDCGARIIGRISSQTGPLVEFVENGRAGLTRRRRRQVFRAAFRPSCI